MKKNILLFSFSVILLFSFCNKDRNSDTAISPITGNDSTLKSMLYPWGAAIKLNKLKTNSKYRNVVISEISSLTTENAMKMGSLSTGRGQYFWDDADFFVNFTQENNIRAHGHTLIWYKQSDTSMPGWVRDFQGSKEEWKQIIKEHIIAVVTRYKGKVTSWDVVNEAIRDDGSFRSADECVWTKNIGVPEYIDWAFQCAHEADPDALLFYNDYGHEYSKKKGIAINNLVKGMQERGIPIHGIGMQMHTGIHKDLEKDIKSAITLAAETGLLIHISELNIGVNKAQDPNVIFTKELEKKQMAYYQKIAIFMKNLPEKQRYGITTWGLCDDDLWLDKGIEWPLIFDMNLEKKLAYYAVRKIK